MLPAVGGEKYLRQTINAERVAAGKNSLARQAKLDAVALRVSQRLAREGGSRVNLTKLQEELASPEPVGLLLGRLQDRGPETGAKFVPDWMEGPNNRGMLYGDWQNFGCGTVRSKEGDMVAVVIFTK